jgi:hypothetical protein
MRTLMLAMVFFAAAATFAQKPEQDTPESFSETIFVVRYALDVRVTDHWGHAIDDLHPEDFIVRIGGKTAHVEGATWVGQGLRSTSESLGVPRSSSEEEEEFDPSEEPEELRGTEELPRSIVLFIQTDFSRVSERVLGQMKFGKLASRIVKLLGPTDRVAVFSHDSHLKFRRDFTLDRQSILDAVRESLYIDFPPPPAPATEGPSLSAILDRREMKKAYDAESALLVIANALHEIEGPKVILLAGWGIGELQGRAGVQLKPEWYEAVRMFHSDHVPVITIDTGLRAQLMAGLKATSAATGGIYTDGQGSREQALTQLEGALAGHYELTLRIDDPLKPGTYPLDIRVTRKNLDVQAPSFVVHGR